MGTLLLILLVLSIPIFYVYGIISFFKSRRKESNTEDIFSEHDTKSYYLQELISTLSARVAKEPSIKGSEVLKELKHELEHLKQKEEKTELSSDVIHFDREEPQDRSVLKKDVSSIWESWYSENSINLLLYIGAFLIVASASIFVGLSWQTFSGVFKATFISIITMAFFASGAWFYYQPKIRNAGVTFTAISALLIPFCSVSWYNFVLKDSGVTFGSVWFVTSIIMIITYTVLILWQKNVFYGFASCLGIVSLMLSLVNVYGLNSDFYILNAIISTYIMFGARFLLQKSDFRGLDKFAYSLEISENIVLPLSLVFGFSMAVSEGKLYSFESSLSAFLVTTYYFFSYILNKKIGYLILSAVLLPVTIAIFYTWQDFGGIYLAYTLNLVAVFYLVFGYVFSKYEKINEVNINIVLSNLLAVLVFLFSTSSNFSDVDLFIFSLTPIITGVVSSIIKKQPFLLFVSTVFSGISAYISMNDILGLDAKMHLISLGFILLTTAYFFLCILFRKHKEYLTVFGVSTFFYGLISMSLVYDKPLYLTLESLLLASFTLSSALIFAKKEIAYVSNALLFLSLWQCLEYFKLPGQYYPLFFMGLEGMFYGVSFFIEGELKMVYRKTGLASLIASPIWFGFSSQSYYYGADMNYTKTLESNSLLNLYFAVLIYGFETMKSKSWQVGYFTSALGITAALWQIKIAGFEDTQFYSLPLALYFMAIAYTRSLQDDEEKRNLFDFIGLSILIFPTMIQAFSADGWRYALMLGVEGVLLLTLGISWQYKYYRYAAIAAIVLAVFSQSYSYLFGLPRWIITGIAGLVFLVVAITLLMKRNDN